MIREAKKETEYRIRYQYEEFCIDPPEFDNLFEDILEEKVKKVFEQKPSGGNV